jgi:hypothetical protein
MSRRLWVVFAVSQAIGVALGVYSSLFVQVGMGGVREFLSILPLILLFPGWLLGALDLSTHLMDRWYAAPFLVSVVVVNAVCWNLIAVLMGRALRHSRPMAKR